MQCSCLMFCLQNQVMVLTMLHNTHKNRLVSTHIEVWTQYPIFYKPCIFLNVDHYVFITLKFSLKIQFHELILVLKMSWCDHAARHGTNQWCPDSMTNIYMSLGLYQLLWCICTLVIWVVINQVMACGLIGANHYMIIDPSPDPH